MTRARHELAECYLRTGTRRMYDDDVGRSDYLGVASGSIWVSWSPGNSHALLLWLSVVVVCNCFPNGKHPKHWPHLSCHTSMCCTNLWAIQPKLGPGISYWELVLLVLRQTAHLHKNVIGAEARLKYLNLPIQKYLLEGVPAIRIGSEGPNYIES